MQIYELLVTGGLVVLIWIIQLLHYPSFRFIDHSRFSEFTAFHANRISFIVLPLMLSELAMGLISKDLISISLIAIIWLSTFFFQVPCHNKLQFGYDEAYIERLITTNWIRTIFWNFKFIYLFLNLTK